MRMPKHPHLFKQSVISYQIYFYFLPLSSVFLKYIDGAASRSFCLNLPACRYRRHFLKVV